MFVCLFVCTLVCLAGYKYHAGGRCVTVFSCSDYCGGFNNAAVAYVHDSQIRLIQVDTKDTE